jgi:hypothetical protein
MEISLSSFQWSIDPTDPSIIHTLESQLPFDTEYVVKSPKTGVVKTFKFSHSTGPEFDPETKWIYHSGSEINGDLFTLIVHNEKELTEKRASDYLDAKLGR